MNLSQRVSKLNSFSDNQQGRYVLYWMQMFKRVSDNDALNFAIQQANERDLPLVVYEGLKFYYPWANDRIHTFILEGVAEKQAEFARLGIRYLFYLQRDEDDPRDTVAHLASDAAFLVTDDYPCFIIPEHNRRLVEQVEVPVFVVDANGVIPLSCYTKEEYAAYTIRPKIKKLLPEYLGRVPLPKLRKQATALKIDCPETEVNEKNIAGLVSQCAIDHSVLPSRQYRGGTKAARQRLVHFIGRILPHYDKLRSKPDVDGSSRLSAYLHFGFISIQEIAEAVKKAKAPRAAKDAFLEEAIVRRELSFNFTRFNPNYDSIASLPPWVQQTMRDHIEDPRPDLLTSDQIEAGETPDELWNAAQRELLLSGEMHNYVRMLWGKRVIEWQPTYESAFAILEHLNNKYALDGRDPNSYAGILWCFGKHDRPWFERPIFGKIRYMTSNSTGRKFDAVGYIEWTKTLL
ncbi:MAG: deoxyribodipyrimidine photo-lyase [Pyrinomonadaceae bacterium]